MYPVPGTEPEQWGTIGVSPCPCERFYKNHTTHSSMSRTRSLSWSWRQPVSLNHNGLITLRPRTDIRTRTGDSKPDGYIVLCRISLHCIHYIPDGHLMLCRISSHCIDSDSNSYSLFLHSTGIRVRVRNRNRICVRQCRSKSHNAM